MIAQMVPATLIPGADASTDLLEGLPKHWQDYYRRHPELLEKEKGAPPLTMGSYKQTDELATQRYLSQKSDEDRSFTEKLQDHMAGGVDAGKELIYELLYSVVHPIETVENIAYAVMHPDLVVQRISEVKDEFVSDWNRGNTYGWSKAVYKLALSVYGTLDPYKNKERLVVILDYYRLVYSEDEKENALAEKNPIVVNSYKLHGFDLRSLWRGESIGNWNENIELYYETGEVPLDFIPNTLSWLICSERAVNIFDETGEDLEVFPVSLYNEGHSRDPITAHVINVLAVVSAMNWEKSDYVSWDDDPKAIKAIRNLVLNRESIPSDADIFRLAESRNFIVVSERLKNQIESKSLTGFGFWKLDTESSCNGGGA